MPFTTTFAATRPDQPRLTRFPVEYEAGVCNIGPEEIASRRRVGHVGTVATIGLFIALVLLGAPPVLRLLLFIPAAVAASGYLQAYLKFCAGFGRLGVYNFGRLGTMTKVADDAMRAADRRKANQIGIASGLIGLAVALVAFLLPV